MATGTALSNYLENKLIDHVTGVASYSAPANRYVALFVSAPGEAGGGTEVTGGSYARQTVTFGTASGGAASNTGIVDFGTASADWGTITYVGIFDAVSGGNLLFYGALVQSKIVGNGDGCKFAVGKLTISLD